jgi:hypothetical protein
MTLDAVTIDVPDPSGVGRQQLIPSDFNVHSSVMPGILIPDRITMRTNGKIKLAQAHATETLWRSKKKN